MFFCRLNTTPWMVPQLLHFIIGRETVQREPRCSSRLVRPSPAPSAPQMDEMCAPGEGDWPTAQQQAQRTMKRGYFLSLLKHLLYLHPVFSLAFFVSSFRADSNKITGNEVGEDVERWIPARHQPRKLLITQWMSKTTSSQFDWFVCVPFLYILHHWTIITKLWKSQMGIVRIILINFWLLWFC